MGTLGSKCPRLRNAKAAPGDSVHVFVNSKSTARKLIIFKGRDKRGTGWVAVGMRWPMEGLRAHPPGPGTRWYGTQSYQGEQASNPGRWLCNNRRMSQKCQRPGKGNLAVGARAVTDNQVLPCGGGGRGQDTWPRAKSPTLSGKGNPALFGKQRTQVEGKVEIR